MIDTGDGTKPEYYLNLKKSLNFDRFGLSGIILTHWHPDHIGGVEEALRSCHVSTQHSVDFQNLAHVCGRQEFLDVGGVEEASSFLSAIAINCLPDRFARLKNYNFLPHSLRLSFKKTAFLFKSMFTYNYSF